VQPNPVTARPPEEDVPDPDVDPSPRSSRRSGRCGFAAETPRRPAQLGSRWRPAVPRVRGQDPRRLSPASRPARVIFLNKTCYNGLYRENRAGRFNVPFGRYVNPAICDAENLRAVAGALAGVTLSCGPYAEAAECAERGDLVYFDPPYDPLSATSSFTAYHRGGFGPDDQKRLRDLFARLAARGVHVVLSNSDTPLVRSLYRGFAIDRVYAARAINSRADRRGKVAEVIVRGSAAGS